MMMMVVTVKWWWMPHRFGVISLFYSVTGRFEITEEDGKQTLIVKDLKLDDAADFVCKIGDRETSAKLQVDEGT